MSANLAVTAPGTTIEKRATGQFSASMNAVRLSGSSLMRISTRNIRVLTEPGSAFTSLSIPLRAGFEIDRFRHCEQYDNTCANLHGMERHFDLSSANTRVLVANCDNPYLRTIATKLGGGEQESTPDLHKRIGLSSQSGALLWRAACSLWLLAGKEHGSAAPVLAIAEGEKELAATILLAAGIDDGPSMSSIGQRHWIIGLQRAEDWILANLDRAISRADLCEVSGLQLRAVTRAFVKYHGESPMLFVRNRRLDAVHRTLLGSEPDETTVTRTAMNMGFCHLGRFAAEYCAAFGEHPSETLHG